MLQFLCFVAQTLIGRAIISLLSNALLLLESHHPIELYLLYAFIFYSFTYIFITELWSQIWDTSREAASILFFFFLVGEGGGGRGAYKYINI